MAANELSAAAWRFFALTESKEEERKMAEPNDELKRDDTEEKIDIL